MAITTVPTISGPSFGGVIYGLNISQGFSNEPTKLTLNIVSKDGKYTTPTLNRSQSVSFGNFSFQGTVWSYDFKESADEKILTVTLIDQSIILDRRYVLLWKRGFLGLNGDKKYITKTFDFSGETILVPSRDENQGIGFGYTKFVEKKLGTESIKTKSQALGSKNIGSLILVGTEKFADSECDIPDTYYTFDDLKKGIQSYVNGSNWPSNSTWRATHEGTLREVLSSWCADLGYDFYWDFRNNRLQFYNVSQGITVSLPNSTASNIISKETGASMEGTFRQYGLAYTARPKSALKTLSASTTIVTNYSVKPIGISYFASKINKSMKFSTSKDSWGKRSLNQFITAGMVGYVHQGLRDLYSFQNKHWDALGYTVDSGLTVDKIKMMDFLKKNGYEDVINNLEKFDAENLPNYNFNFINRDENTSKKWQEIEQKMLGYHGRFYRIPDKPGSFFYCNANYTITISIDVDPAASLKEDNSEDFAGKLIYDRGGQMSHDSAALQDILKINELTQEIENCAPRHIELKESGLLQDMILSGLIGKDNSKKINNLVIFPKSETFVKQKLGFVDPNLSSGSNDLETTWVEEQNKNASNGQKTCEAYEENLRKGSCISAEEGARKNAIKKAGGIPDDQKPQPPDWVSGLNNKIAKSCTVKTNKGSATFYLPSDSTLRVITKFNIDINKISNVDTAQFLWTVGNPGGADDVAELRIANDNITDPNEDTYQKKRDSELIRPADSAATSPNQTIKYTFAGNPPSDLTLSPTSGLTNLDITLSSDGFTTSASFSTRPPKPSRQNSMVRYTQSQLNRTSFNAS
jgi:hypothetical protein